MAKRDTAEHKLNRILYLLPAAARPGGVELGALAEAMGVDRTKAGRDAIEAIARGDYHAAGMAGEAQLVMDNQRVTLATPGGFRRPARLVAREAAALGLGLRALAAEASEVRREALIELAGVVERELVLGGRTEAGERVLATHGDHPAGESYERLRQAAAERRACWISYLKADSAEAELRVVEPYALLFAERWWYAVAHCRERQGVRLFRTDRVLEAKLLDERFEPPADLDVAAYAPGGRAFVAEGTIEAVVRYGSRIADWIKERHPEAETNPDGSLVVPHAVADPQWLVRHVLQYGADAEVLKPTELRAAVRESALRLAAGRGVEATAPAEA